MVRFGVLHTREPGGYGVWGGWWGSPGCGAPRGGSQPLKNCGWGWFAVGTPLEQCRGRELSWEREIPSGVDALSSHPSRPASPRAARKGQPEREEPSKREIRRYQTSDLKRGKSGDFLLLCYKLTPSSRYGRCEGGREGGVRARGGCILRFSKASLFFLKATEN